MVFDIFCIVLGFIVVSYLLGSRSCRLPTISDRYALILTIIAVLFLFLAPYGFDRKQYQIMFLNPGIWSYKDSGWEVYNAIMRIITDYNADLFFLFNDIIYTALFVVFIYYFIKPGYRYYLLLLTIISIGFYNGGVNIMRSGLAVSIIFLGLRFYKNSIIFILCCIVACSIHLSVGLICAGIVLGYYFPKLKIYFFIWLVCLVLSYTNSLGELLQGTLSLMGDSAYRLEGYTSGIGEKNELYDNAGWRLDFIIYSSLPLLFVYYYKVKNHFKDRLYDTICSAYLLVNSFWLCVIRMPFTDRIALLSWVMIPVMSIYPVLVDNSINGGKRAVAYAFIPPMALLLFYLLI